MSKVNLPCVNQSNGKVEPTKFSMFANWKSEYTMEKILLGLKHEMNTHKKLAQQCLFFFDPRLPAMAPTQTSTRHPMGRMKRYVVCFLLVVACFALSQDIFQQTRTRLSISSNAGVSESPVVWVPHEDRVALACRRTAGLEAAVASYLAGPKKGTIIWNCQVNCVGYGHRHMKGIASAFLISILMNRSFFIKNQRPTDIFNLAYQPGPAMARPPLPPVFLGLRMLDTDPVQDIEFVLGAPEHIIMETNGDLLPHLLTIPAFRAKLEAWGIPEGPVDISGLFECLHLLLFRLHPTAEAYVRRFRQSNSHFIALQIQSPPAESGAPRTTPPLDRYWPAVDKLLARAPRGQHVIFLTTDTQPVVEAVRARYRHGPRVIVTEGPVTHSDNDAAPLATIGFEKVLLDHYLVGEARGAVVTESGFGLTALWRTRMNATVVPLEPEAPPYRLCFPSGLASARKLI